MKGELHFDENIDVSKEIKVFASLLKKSNMKITDQRLKVAEQIFQTHDHFTADEITDHFKSTDTSVSKATIYRILAILVENGLILEHDFALSQKVYEHCYGHEHHDHLICTECGEITEFVNQEIEQLQKLEAQKHEFKVTRHTMNLYGICKKCQS